MLDRSRIIANSEAANHGNAQPPQFIAARQVFVGEAGFEFERGGALGSGGDGRAAAVVFAYGIFCGVPKMFDEDARLICLWQQTLNPNKVVPDLQLPCPMDANTLPGVYGPCPT